jgi:DNA-binding NarL/FixJ family response regulator
MASLSLAVADDQPVLLEGISSVFGLRAEFEIVGVVIGMDGALKLVDRTRPDVFIFDPALGDDGLRVIQRIADHAPMTKVLAFTAVTSAEFAAKVLHAGAYGYMLKTCSPEDLVTSVRAVGQGQTYLMPGFAAEVIAHLKPKTARDNPTPDKLTYREDQIIRMLLGGRRNKEIAAALNLKEKTVKSYMTTLMQKLNARSRLEVVVALQQRRDPGGKGMDRRPDILVHASRVGRQADIRPTGGDMALSFRA